MNLWKYFDITHRKHLLCNPMHHEKFENMISLLPLKPSSHVLDIATGKAEFLIQLAERYSISGVGIDRSPYCIAEAQKKYQMRVPEADLRFLEMDGALYTPEPSEQFDAVACIGACWVYQGYLKTLQALFQMGAAESWIVVGEPYWRQDPPKAYLEAIEHEQSAYRTHAENVQLGHTLGLELVYTLVSSEDDWDQYEGLQWYAAESWASEHSTDPDVEEVLDRVRQDKAAYLKWGRDTLGWAIYVFKKGGYGRIE